jgi:hypothetical protein
MTLAVFLAQVQDGLGPTNDSTATSLVADDAVGSAVGLVDTGFH